ncbi:MAG: hypothetical protein ACWA41_12795 [Putridiphycobacter sp.]
MDFPLGYYNREDEFVLLPNTEQNLSLSLSYLTYRSIKQTIVESPFFKDHELKLIFPESLKTNREIIVRKKDTLVNKYFFNQKEVDANSPEYAEEK